MCNLLRPKLRKRGAVLGESKEENGRFELIAIRQCAHQFARRVAVNNCGNKRGRKHVSLRLNGRLAGFLQSRAMHIVSILQKNARVKYANFLLMAPCPRNAFVVAQRLNV